MSPFAPWIPRSVSGYRILYKVREGGNLVIVEAILPRNPRTYTGRR
jgi:hypothetical protein